MLREAPPIFLLRMLSYYHHFSCGMVSDLRYVMGKKACVHFFVLSTIILGKMV